MGQQLSSGALPPSILLFLETVSSWRSSGRKKKTPQGLIALGDKWSFLGNKGSSWKSRKVLDGSRYNLVPQKGHHTADYVMISDRRRKDMGTRRGFPFPLWVQNHSFLLPGIFILIPETMIDSQQAV